MLETQQIIWSPDAVLPGFGSTVLSFEPDYEGEVTATLVRKEPLLSTSKAVLYIHGYTDYFFQAHLAEQFAANGFNFYALDLRKYGRSLLPHQHPNFCKSISEYYSEITAAIECIITGEGHNQLLVNGHSTGGLITALYAHEGSLKQRIHALFLNSPFFDFNVNPVEKLLLNLLPPLGRRFPYLVAPGGVAPYYAESLHKDYRGEWDFDTRWKPIKGFPVYLGWLQAIREAHHRLHQGLNIACPVLVMHSDKSTSGKRWHDQIQSSDCVLNVEHMRRWSAKLGQDVTRIEIPDGMHDLALSRSEVREKLFQELFRWLEPRF